MAKRASTPIQFTDQTRICVLHGPEMMLKRQYLQQLRQTMEQAHGEVETLTFNAANTDLAEVFDELRSYGLMQQYKLIIVDEADQFVTQHRAALERYAQAPVDHATLVLRSVKWNRGNLDKAIAKVGLLAKCEPPSAPEAARWLVKQAKDHHQCTLDHQTATILVARLGRDLMLLDAELGKLALMTIDGTKIDQQLIDQLVGRSSDEQAWAVQEAVLESLSSGSTLTASAGGKAIEKIHELVDLSGQPDVLVMYFVADLVRKLNTAMQMKLAGETEASIARQLKLWGPRQALFMNLTRRLTPQKTAKLLDMAVAADTRSKSGLGTSMRNLECFCTMLADQLK